MKKCLITGCNGFIGSYLAEFLVNSNIAVCGTIHSNSEKFAHLNGKITTYKCEITDKENVVNIVTQVRPDVVFHLASQSRVKQSWQNPEETFKVNISGTIHLLEALREVGGDPVVVVVCSAAEYGCRGRDSLPITEKSELRPSDPYAVSKVAQDLLANIYWENYDLKVIRVRPFNITGPGMTGDACSDFAKGISEIEKGTQSALNVGDLSSVRDITDVRDAVIALWTMLKQGQPGEVYNICSGVGYRIGDILEKLVSLSSAEIRVIENKNNRLSSKQNIQVGSNCKLGKLGWKPTIPFKNTLSDVLDYWRKKDL